MLNLKSDLCSTWSQIYQSSTVWVLDTVPANKKVTFWSLSSIVIIWVFRILGVGQDFHISYILNMVLF